MSSAWEGLPTVLMEALACGCPIVSTDCQSGPREILDEGSIGALVGVGDHEALATAILRGLEAPPDRERLTRRAMVFSVDGVADRYLDVLFNGHKSAADLQVATRVATAGSDEHLAPS
jgi:glycosyltransferase involved in cell wall biosynthesis